MSFDVVPDLILIVEVSLFIGFTIFAFFRAQRITRSASYFLILLGLIGQLIAYCLFIATLLINPIEENKSTVLILAIGFNVLSSIAFLMMMNGLILIREDKLPVFSHIAAVLVGISSMLFGFVSTTQLEYNPSTHYWELDYLKGEGFDYFQGAFKYVFLAVSLTTSVIFLTYFAFYLTRKFQIWKKTRKFDFVFLGFAFLAAWMITPFFQEAKVFRQYLFPLALLCWGIALFLNPLDMLVSNKLPHEIILVTNTDQPVFRYNLQEKEINRNLKDVQMMITGTRIIDESVKPSKKKDNLTVRSKEIKYINLSQYSIIQIGSRIDRNSKAALIKSFKDLYSQTNLDYLSTALVMKEKDENLFKKILDENFLKIDATKE